MDHRDRADGEGPGRHPARREGLPGGDGSDVYVRGSDVRSRAEPVDRRWEQPTMRALAIGLALFLAAGAVALAHHGLEAFDQTSKVTLKGTVTAFHFVNPHSVVEFDVKD